MNKYNYNGIEFSTDLKFFRARIAKSFSITEEDGVVLICGNTAKIKTACEITRLRNYYFNYNGAIFRRVNTNSINIKIYSIIGLEEVTKVEDEYNLTILVPSTTRLVDYPSIIEGMHLEYISGTPTGYFETNLCFNKDVNIVGTSSYLNPAALNEQYILDMTQTVSGVMDYLETYLAPEEFLLKHYPLTEDVSTTELALISYNEFPQSAIRLLPNFGLNYTEYKLPMTLRISTASISKFERLLADYGSIKFLSDINVITIKDKYDEDWNIPFKWDFPASTNDASEAKDGAGNVGFEITLSFTINFFNVRDNKAVVITELLQKLLKDE